MLALRKGVQGASGRLEFALARRVQNQRVLPPTLFHLHEQLQEGRQQPLIQRATFVEDEIGMRLRLSRPLQDMQEIKRRWSIDPSWTRCRK